MALLNQEDFMSKYGDTLMYFRSYYKYTFTFQGTTPDGLTVTATSGGGSDEIYRLEVIGGSNGPLKSIDPTWAIVRKANNQEVDEMEDQSW